MAVTEIYRKVRKKFAEGAKDTAKCELNKLRVFALFCALRDYLAVFADYRTKIKEGVKMDIFQKCWDFIEAKEARRTGYYPYFHPLSSAQEPEVVIEGHRMIMIGSNNYLGLTTHPKVKEAALEAVRRFGTGCTGSRFLTGTLELHIELEKKLAEFMGKETALVFTTGFLTNLGTISALVDRRDLLILDNLDHASIIDGARLSFGRVIKFKHNDMQDLARILKEHQNKPKLIVIDGVFSMEGDIAKLPEIVRLAKTYKARVMVDDAHSIGVLGKNGRGTAEHFNLMNEVDLIMGTFSKSFASIGGFITGKFDVIDYIKHKGRAMIFSAALPPASIAAVSAVLDIIKNEPERRERLWANTKKMQSGFKNLGFDIGTSETPIIPIIVGDDRLAFEMWKQLMERGIFANPIITPAVPPGRAMIRTSYTATHTEEQLNCVLEAFREVGEKLGVI